MAMIPTPTTPGMGSEEALYRGAALAQLRILKQQMQLGKLFIGNRKIKLDNGVEILCNIAGRHESVRVVLPDTVPAVSTKVADAVTHGFAMHPRTDQYPDGADFSSPLDGGGYQPLDYDTATSVMFPAYDDDHGTMLLYQNNTAWRAKIQIPENYGILSWVSKDKTVTWRGWPAITLAPGRTTSVEGVTSLDAQTSYNTYYTPLAPYLYVNGRKFPTPGKVRGAAMPTTGTVLVSTVNYTQYDIAGFSDNTINPDGQNWLYDNGLALLPEANRPGNAGNYYDELYIKAASGTAYLVNGRVRYPFDGATNQSGDALNGWLRIGHKISPVTNLPVWFDAEGKRAVSEEGEWWWEYQPIALVDGEYPAVTLPDGSIARPQGSFTSGFTVRTGSANTFTLQTSPAYRQFTPAANAWLKCFMINAHAMMTHSCNDVTTVQTTYISKYKRVPHLLEKRPDPTDQHIEVVNTWYDTDAKRTYFQLSAVGFKGTLPADWVSNLKLVSIPATCKSTCNTVSLTETVTDSCGFAGTITVTANDCVPGGRWVADPWVYYGYPCGCVDVRVYGWNYTITTDTVRTTYYVFYCSEAWCPGTQSTCPPDPYDYFGWGGCGFLEKKLVENWVC